MTKTLIESPKDINLQLESRDKPCTEHEVFN